MDYSKFNTEQQQAIKARGNVCVISSAGSGKCVNGDTYIYTNKGILKIKDIPLHFEIENDECMAQIVSHDIENFNKLSTFTSHWFNMGMSKTIKLKTSQGYSIEGTPEHPIVVLNQLGNLEFKKLKDVSSNDIVAISMNNDVWGSEEIDNEIAYLLGVYTGDGSMNGENRESKQYEVSYAKADEYMYENVNKIILDKFKTNIRTYHKKNSNSTTHRFISKEIYCKLKEDYDLSMTTAEYKKIPRSIMMGNKENAKNFLQGLFDTDAYCNYKTNQIEYCTASKQLAEEVQILLLNFGIVCRLRERYNKKYNKNYYYIIIGSSDTRTFEKLIGFRLDLKNKQNLSFSCTKKCNENKKVLYNQSERFINLTKELKNRNNRKFIMNFYDYITKRKNATRNTIEKLTHLVQDEIKELHELDLISENYFFDKIHSIENSESIVYDFTVPNTHCFVSNGFISHNTTLLIGRTIDLINSGVPDDCILLVTFSKSATTNMKERLEKLMPHNTVKIGTFHSVCYSILKAEDAYFQKATIMREYNKKKILEDVTVKSMNLYKKASDVEYPAILSFISIQKANMKEYTDKDLYSTSEMPFGIDTMRNIYKHYELEKTRQGFIDFDDMQNCCVKLLRRDSRVLKKYQEKFKYILVDESQDVNECQIELLQMLNKNNNQMFWVGDFRQSLYGFRGSNPDFIMNFDKLFQNASIMHMNLNYRCSKPIVEYSNLLLSYSDFAKHKFYKEASANKDGVSDPQYNIYFDNYEEARAIGAKIKDLMHKNSSLKYKDFAIITRLNAQTCAVENIFAELELPYIICGGSKSFFELKEVQDILAFLKLAKHKDDSAFERIYCVPPRWLGKVFLEELRGVAMSNGTTLYDAMKLLNGKNFWRYKDGIEQIEKVFRKVKAMIGHSDIGEIIRTIRQVTLYDSYISKDLDEEGASSGTKIDNLDSLCDQASHYKDIDKFLVDIEKIIALKEEKTQDASNYENVNAIRVMTAHKSKGLEFKYVFGISLNSGILPHYKAQDVEEERRILYVLMTRAENELFLSSTTIYNNRSMMPSEFMYDIFDEKEIEEKLNKVQLF